MFKAKWYDTRGYSAAAVGLLCGALLLAGCGASSTVARAITPCASADCAAGAGARGVHVFVEPDAGEAPILRAIAGARVSVWVEVYILTDRGVLRALEDAASRGVDVRVLLELHPFGGGEVSAQRTVEELNASGVHARGANPAFTYTHEKALVLDGATAYILTYARSIRLSPRPALLRPQFPPSGTHNLPSR